MSRGLLKPPTILTDEQVTAVTRGVEALFPPQFKAVARQYGVRYDDIIHCGSLGASCREGRERLGLSVKDAAQRIGAPQYRLHAVEAGRIDAAVAAVVRKYVALVGIESWYARWRRANRELAARLGLGPMPRGKRGGRPKSGRT
jgi:hypothetical protein